GSCRPSVMRVNAQFPPTGDGSTSLALPSCRTDRPRAQVVIACGTGGARGILRAPMRVLSHADAGYTIRTSSGGARSSARQALERREEIAARLATHFASVGAAPLPYARKPTALGPARRHS